MGVGVIIRDVEGEVLPALSMPRSNISFPGMAEVNALWRALQLSAELGIEHVIFEGDALEIKRPVNSKMRTGNGMARRWTTSKQSLQIDLFGRSNTLIGKETR
ncbi:hypothetical protein F2P56_019159 [Juglans regia]|uniref:RNase H type-1 domain-containing protein n=1 Tax=Juglans regia TaxID=51240 RepID=A0A833XBA9_JUGRE|nr:hypothetical protein F2P56_019159 [Juglans regia]